MSESTVYGKVASKASKNSAISTGPKVFGLCFPTGSKNTGPYFCKSSGVELFRNNLRQLLLTTKGERVMLPNFGANLKRYLFEPLDQVSFSQIKAQIVETIRS